VELDEIYVICNVTVTIVPIIPYDNIVISVKRGTDKIQKKKKTNKQTNLEFWELDVA